MNMPSVKVPSRRDEGREYQGKFPFVERQLAVATVHMPSIEIISCSGN